MKDRKLRKIQKESGMDISSSIGTSLRKREAFFQKDLETMLLRHIFMREMHRCFFKLKVPCPFQVGIKSDYYKIG